MAKLEPADRLELGPFDVSEIGVLTPYLDFGSLRISPQPGITIKADVDENSKRIVSLSLELDGHRLQVQAFAATKSDGLWEMTMNAIAKGINEQNGLAEIAQGVLGPELRVQTSVTENGKRFLRESRFVGVDGPRWFLRGVLTGPEIYQPTTYIKLVNLYRSVAVNRGETALPPGELLPITLPTANE
ncbi:MAG: DUF3710 domain-containing protein [Actinobacteria bacterium]|nr:DUF3710 domain-containing protein [Actinomycetota bacterium]